MSDLGQRSVEPDGLVRVVVHRGLDQEGTDEAERHHAGEIAEGSDPLDPAADAGAHLLRLGILEEVLADAPVPLVEADADQDNADDPDQPDTARPAEDACRRLLRVAGAAARAEQDLDRDRAKAGVDDAVRERGDAIHAAVRVFRPVPEQGAREPPEGVAAQADRDEDEQHLAQAASRSSSERPAGWHSHRRCRPRA